MSLEVEIAPLEEENDFLVGFPCLGPVAIKGMCRVANLANTTLHLRSLEIQLVGDAGGSTPNAVPVDPESLLFACQRLVIPDGPPIAIERQTFVDLPFQFQFSAADADMLPPSTCISRGYAEGFVKYELRVVWADPISGGSMSRNNHRYSEPAIFRFPRFDVDDMGKHLSGTAVRSISGKSADGAVSFQFRVPASIIPDDFFFLEFEVFSAQQRRQILAVQVQMVEILALKTREGIFEKEDLALEYIAEPPRQPAFEFTRTAKVRAPRWFTSTAPFEGDLTITPSVLVGPLKISHKMLVTLHCHGADKIEIELNLYVLPVTRYAILELACNMGLLMKHPNPNAPSVANLIQDYLQATAPPPDLEDNDIPEDPIFIPPPPSGDIMIPPDPSDDIMIPPPPGSDIGIPPPPRGQSRMPHALHDDDDEMLQQVLRMSMAEAAAAQPKAPARGKSINGAMAEDEAMRLALEASKQEVDPLMAAEDEALRLALLESEKEARLYGIVAPDLSAGPSGSSSGGAKKTVVAMPDEEEEESLKKKPAAPSTPTQAAAQPAQAEGLKPRAGLFTIVGSTVQSAIEAIVPGAAEPEVKKEPPKPPPGLIIKEEVKIPYSKIMKEGGDYVPKPEPFAKPEIEPRLASRLSKRLTKRDGFTAAAAPASVAAVSVDVSHKPAEPTSPGAGSRPDIKPRTASAPKTEEGKNNRYRVVFDYIPNRAGEIELTKGDIVVVTKTFQDGGCLGYLESSGKRGRFPLAALSATPI
ncbi:hypothetical protein HDU97_006677 [Phlyctochytrium planicorne]|nr:hypothetical protein HDU97_006677 [Phlyctochytrium planicorne]